LIEGGLSLIGGEIFSQHLVGVDWASDVVEGVGQRALRSSGEVAVRVRERCGGVDGRDG
jgi:hypothetical protein